MSLIITPELLARIAGATAGKVVTSDGTTWVASTPTFPNASASSGKFIRSDGTNWIASTPTLPTSAGAAGKILVSDATNYIESTPTFPNASATSGKIIKSDGTNWIASTETYAAPGTSGNILTSDGTNWTSAAASTGWTQLNVITNDFTTTSTSAVDITGLVTATLTNSTLYEFEAGLRGNGADTNGLKFAFHGGGTGGAATVQAGGSGSSGTSSSNAIDTLTGATFASSTTNQMYYHGFFTTRGSGTATFSIQVAKVTSGTATITKGSWFRYRLAIIA